MRSTAPILRERMAFWNRKERLHHKERCKMLCQRYGPVHHGNLGEKWGKERWQQVQELHFNGQEKSRLKAHWKGTKMRKNNEELQITTITADYAHKTKGLE